MKTFVDSGAGLSAIIAGQSLSNTGDYLKKPNIIAGHFSRLELEAQAAGFIPRDKRRWRPITYFVAPALTLFFITATSSPAQPTYHTDSQVMAAYLYNFGKFVKWQGERSPGPAALEICILGKDPFGPVLDSTVAGERVDARKVKVRRLSKIEESVECSILFISSSEEDRLDPILAEAQHSGMLTVSDIPHFAERGGIIGFVMRQDRIRFEVNRGTAEQSHLVLSSELLKVASKVIEKAATQS
jgi:hypothetical protein